MSIDANKIKILGNINIHMETKMKRAASRFLSKPACNLYLYMLGLYTMQLNLGNKDPKISMTNANLATNIWLNERHPQNLIRELCEKGFILKKIILKKPNVYTVLVPEEFWNAFIKKCEV